MGSSHSKDGAKPQPSVVPKGAAGNHPPPPGVVNSPPSASTASGSSSSLDAAAAAAAHADHAEGLVAEFKELALEKDVLMPVLSRVKREKFIELKALRDLYKEGIISKPQYERSRDHILVTQPSIASAPESESDRSPFSPPQSHAVHTIPMPNEELPPDASSFAAFFNYAPEYYADLVEWCRASSEEEPMDEWWSTNVKALSVMHQCTIFTERLAAALCLPWRCVVAAVVLLHRYGQVLANWASVADAEEYFQTLSLPNRVIVCSSCLLLASKVEETLFSMRRLLLAIKKSLASQFNHLLLAISSYGDSGKVVAERLATSIKQHEIDMLMRLGFDIVVEHPHHYVPLLCRFLGADALKSSFTSERALTHTTFMLLDCLLPSNMWLFYRPQMIALATLYVAWTVSVSVAKSSTGALSPRSLRKTEFDWTVYNINPHDRSDIRELVQIIIDSMWIAASVRSELAPLRDATVTVPLPGSEENSGRAPKVYAPAACRSVDNFKVEEDLDEGTYGCVSVARDIKTNETVALKLLKNTNGRSGFPYYMLREILFLQRLNHRNIVRGKEIVVNRNSSDISASQFLIVMEYIAYDLREVWFQQRDKTMQPAWTEGHIKNLMMQLLRGVAYMHQLGIMHRDIKLKNLLLDTDGTVKVADLGSIRETGRTQLKLTTAVVTLWYRPPELLLGAKDYTSAIDMWSIGCVFVELLALKPPFPGYSVPEMMSWIISVLGSPPPDVWERCFSSLPEGHGVPEFDVMPDARPLNVMLSRVSPGAVALIQKMLAWDPAQRITAFEALSDPYFTQDPPPEVFVITSAKRS